MLFFGCGEAVESKLVKLETSYTVILPPTVIVICMDGRDIALLFDLANEVIM